MTQAFGPRLRQGDEFLDHSADGCKVTVTDWGRNYVVVESPRFIDWTVDMSPREFVESDRYERFVVDGRA